MPEIRHFIVTQTREVRVTANTLEDAVRIASAAFFNGQHKSEPTVLGSSEGVWGNTSSRVRETELYAKER